MYIQLLHVNAALDHGLDTQFKICCQAIYLISYPASCSAQGGKITQLIHEYGKRIPDVQTISGTSVSSLALQYIHSAANNILAVDNVIPRLYNVS